ncbi:tetratricopeptide repeat protein [Deferrisoma palaeochoriense]
MAIDRDKVARAALRYIQKGQYEKAAEEYKRLLALDPRDMRARLRLLELYGRMGKRKEVVEESERVAEVYADQGFYLKAIAVYKQAARHDPENPGLWRAMGEMYAKQGLVGDALASFKRAVELLRAQHLTAEAQELLGRMEQMAPDNAAIKVHLAELYLEDGRMGAFEEVLGKLMLQLRGEGRNRKLLQILEGFYERSGKALAVGRRLAELLVDLGEEERALEVIREGLAADPGDRDLRLLALRAYLILGQLAEARKVALDLYEEDPEDLFLLEQLAAIAQARGDRKELADAYRAMAKVYGRRGIEDKEALYYRKVLEIVPDDAEARLALGEVLEMPPPSEEAEAWEGGPVIAEEEPGAEGPDPLEDEILEVELYLKYGMDEQAAEKLRSLVERAPARIDLRRKLRDACERRGDREGWVREQLQIAELLLQERRENEALRAYQSVLEVDPQNAEARKAIQYLKPGAVEGAAPAVEIELDASAIEFVEGEAGEQVVRRGAREATAEDSDALREGLAEAEFLEAQGRKDEAVQALLRLKDRFPGSPHVLARLEVLGWSPRAEEDEGFVDLQAEVLDDSGLRFEGFEDFEVSELDDIVTEFKAGIAEKLEEGDFDTHYHLGTAYREMGLVEEALEEFRIAARSPEKAREAYAAMASLYREQGNRADARSALKMALAVPSNAPEDRAAILYELGDLSEEEGDLEGALRHFEKAEAEAPGFRDVASRLRKLRAVREGA